jgi:hypothetical protein
MRQRLAGKRCRTPCAAGEREDCGVRCARALGSEAWEQPTQMFAENHRRASDGRLRIRSGISLLLVASLSGCVTTNAAIDLVQPNPIVEVAVRRIKAPNGEPTLDWRLLYGDHEGQFAHITIHETVDHRGTFALPSWTEDCEWFQLRMGKPTVISGGPYETVYKYDNLGGVLPTRLPPNDRCSLFVLANSIDGAHRGPGDVDRIIIYEPNGPNSERAISYMLPAETPIVDARRWGHLLVAPFLDIFWTAVLIPQAALAVIVSPAWLVSEGYQRPNGESGAGQDSPTDAGAK